MNKGFIPILIAIIVVIAGALGLIYVAEKAAPTPVPDSVGVPFTYSPVPATAKTTIVRTPIPKATVAPTAAPATSKPLTITTSAPSTFITATTPFPSVSCDHFKASDGNTTINFTFEDQNGRTLQYSPTVKITAGSPCPGTIPPEWGGSILHIVDQGQKSWISPSMTPGYYSVDATYGSSTQSLSVPGLSGTVNVVFAFSN
ncbi:hypothetical protein BH10PAT1_BH10PAT1_4570 [soil metagenome]